MIGAGARIFVATDPVDMRRGFCGLTALATDRVGGDPKSGALFVFVNAKRDRLKALWYDRTGFALLYKKLDRGEFRLPSTTTDGATSVTIEATELALILEGIVLPARRIRPKEIAREGKRQALRAIASMPNHRA